MTTHLKDELNAIFGRELTVLELANVEASFLRNGFKRERVTADLPAAGKGGYKCYNAACVWTGKLSEVVVKDGIKCCPRCDHTVRIAT
jgi:hypothetical protein